MTTFTEIVAAVVVHSSAVAMSHFGVTMEPARTDSVTPPAAERVIARAHPAQHRAMRLSSCHEPRPAPHRLTV
jgi:hypothetical protein